MYIAQSCRNDAGTQIKLETLPGGIRHIVTGIKQDTAGQGEGRARVGRGARRENRLQKSDPSHGVAVMRPIRRRVKRRFQSVV